MGDGGRPFFERAWEDQGRDTTFGQTLHDVKEAPLLTPVTRFSLAATSTYLVSGSADNMMKLWLVRTGECLKTWEFTTAVKRVQWSEDDSKVRGDRFFPCSRAAARWRGLAS